MPHPAPGERSLSVDPAHEDGLPRAHLSGRAGRHLLNFIACRRLFFAATPA
jgi:hypothetical protein